MVIVYDWAINYSFLTCSKIQELFLPGCFFILFHFLCSFSQENASRNWEGRRENDRKSPSPPRSPKLPSPPRNPRVRRRTKERRVGRRKARRTGRRPPLSPPPPPPLPLWLPQPLWPLSMMRSFMTLKLTSTGMKVRKALLIKKTQSFRSVYFWCRLEQNSDRLGSVEVHFPLVFSMGISKHSL